MDLDARWQRNWDRTQKRRLLRERAIAYLGGVCEICRYDGSPLAFDFHHPNPREKDFNISDKIECSWEIVRAEIDKCHLLCARCHREVHDGYHPSYMEDEDSVDRGQLDVIIEDFNFSSDGIHEGDPEGARVDKEATIIPGAPMLLGVGK